jgi:hypothetical protein
MTLVLHNLENPTYNIVKWVQVCIVVPRYCPTITVKYQKFRLKRIGWVRGGDSSCLLVRSHLSHYDQSTGLYRSLYTTGDDFTSLKGELCGKWLRFFFFSPSGISQFQSILANNILNKPAISMGPKDPSRGGLLLKKPSTPISQH